MSGNEPPVVTGTPNKAPRAPSSPPMSSSTGSGTDPFVAAVQQSYAETTCDNLKPHSFHGSSLVAPSPGVKKPSHNRTVSWGMPTTSPIPHPTGNGAIAGNGMPLPSWDGTTLSGSKTEKLDIHDIINAGGHTEMEAETYILQAVEKISVRPRSGTEVSDLYSTIVEDEIFRSKQDASFDYSDEEEEADDEVEVELPQQPRPTPTKQTSHSTVTSNSRFKGLVRRDRTVSDTVEGTLFGLTSALRELDDEHVNSTSSYDEAVNYETTFTGADKLANAANKMLSKENEQTKSGNNVAVPGSAKVDKDVSHSSSDGDGRKDKRRSVVTDNRVVKGATKGVKEEWELFNSFFTSRKDKMKAYLKKTLMMILLPSLGLAFFLYYIVENPDLCPVQKLNGTVAPSLSPSAAPSLSPSMAPTEMATDPWLVSWIVNETTALANMTANATSNATEAPSIAPDSFFKEIDEFLVCPGLGASVSWWFLFLGVRQVITFSLALIAQAFIIEYLALSSRLLLNTFGPVFTLLIVQAKGWPFVLTFWAIFDLILLNTNEDDASNLSDENGYVRFVHHWGYMQDWIGLFNESNPSGDVVSNEWNERILVNAIIVGVAVAVKRLVVGLLLGRQTFAHFGEDLSRVLRNSLLVGEVATLARKIEDTQEDFRDHFSLQGTSPSVSSNNWNARNLQAIMSQETDESDAADNDPVVASAADAANAFMASRKDEAAKSLNKANMSIRTVGSFESVMSRSPEFSQSQQLEMAELLDAWEESQTAEEKEEKKITIGAVLQFRQALAFMKKKYPFLPAFGPADTREACIESAQRVYDRLILRTPFSEVLPFETLALLAKKDNGTIDKEKAKELIRLFRPDRHGRLGKLEWVKSVDVIYKELRLLSANISNSSQMDAAVESLVNVVFYVLLGALIIYRLGEDPLALFLSFSSVLLAFAFMFGKSSSKYFDGCLFILLQRPYGVGDRMHLSNPDKDTSPDGSSGWIVEKVTLFTTSVYWGATNERATLCNGAISNLRVINAARSPNATVAVELRFGIDTEYEKVEIFRSAVEEYLKDRPREWLTFVGFRPSEVAPEKGYIGYKVIAQHRNSWQAIGSIVESKANLTTYCLEVAKQLEMRYLSPSLPVSLTLPGQHDLSMPELGENLSGDSINSSEYPDSSPGDKAEAHSAIANSGLRHRRGKSRFAELVRMVMENKDT